VKEVGDELEKQILRVANAGPLVMTKKIEGIVPRS
jgi:hypothetical protein